MRVERIHRKIERTADQQRGLAEIRERFQRERPGPQDLLAAGDVTEFVTQSEYLDLLSLLAALKQRRESLGLSPADVADRCGMDLAAVLDLENGVQMNPTMDTLYRYAAAIGMAIGFSTRPS